MQHFSTRIPWKDNGFTGRIDNNPTLNVAAQTLPNIASSRDLEFEEANRGKLYSEIDTSKVKDWITENAAFMSTEKLHIKMVHPYSKRNNKKFTHYIETDFTVEPYSFLLRPFSWTLIANASERQAYYNFHFDAQKTKEMLSWSSLWISHGDSQKGIFDYFFSGIVPNTSLIFPYFKQVPFIEDNRRIIAGIGNITSAKVESKEYASDGSREERNYVWEHNVSHSIRENGKEGFLMPYEEISKYVNENPDFDVSSVTLFEPAGFRDEFSYAAEWVSYDAVIDVLNQAIIVLNNIAKLGLKKADFEWVNNQLEYVNQQLINVWNQRGVFPGLGSALTAFGVSYGFDIARYVDTTHSELMIELSHYFSGEKEIGEEKLDESLANKENEYNGLLKNDKRVKYFEILSRLNLSVNQAKFAWSKREHYAEKVIKNPYLLYELTRNEIDEYQITVAQIDNGMFVNSHVNNNYNQLQKPTKMRTEGDKRRFRAMVICVLNQAAEQGHTLLHYKEITSNINKLSLDRRTDFQTEMIEGVQEFLSEGDLYVDDKNRYIKLLEYQEFKKIVLDVVNASFETVYPSHESWRKIIDSQFGELQAGNEAKDQEARKEKTDALKILESSRISVLLGKAGTGKTSVLGLFASAEKIKEGGVLALTPTGKSRVQLENSFGSKIDANFMTVAQFLIRSGGFNSTTMTYKMPNKPSTSSAKTIIIDESSMLTEEMFAGILKLVNPHAERIIFTGDPNQLPPIGAGRPFVDLINYLKKKSETSIAKLSVEMRQGTGGDDLSFAQLFSDSSTDEIDKNIIYRIQNNELDHRLKYIQYSDTKELEEIFFEELVSITKMRNKEDIAGFDKSLGATLGKSLSYKTSKHLEDWQVLSPTKFVGLGSYFLNNQIHQQYRQDIVEKWQQDSWARSKPLSNQNIVFGDKVISNRNNEIPCWDGKNPRSEYIANGEIGIMVGYPVSRRKKNGNTQYYNFRFSSFEGKVFSYRKSDFNDERVDSKLELAYALTVHKSQGSGFGKTIVVLNGKSSYITKELLYTAFSRQEETLVILSDLPIDVLFQYSSDWYSDIKQRYTDLFEAPNLVEIELNKQKRFLEEKLIHKTHRGELVRSKSEVIVTEVLNRLGVDYSYEEPVVVQENFYIPDFTLRYRGRKAYLEHLGMLSNASYKRKWKKKKKNYERAGISEALGNLIITTDGLDGSIDALTIENDIRKWMEKN